jgi:diacylglycerol kinase family enzyme
MKRLEARFPKSKSKFERAAFRSVAWELLSSYAGKVPDLAVRVDGGERSPSLSVMIGRTDPYTYYKDRGVRVTPDASLDAGLDVLSARYLPRRSVLRIAWQVLGSARHVRGRDIDYWHNVSTIEVRSAVAFPVQVDGDVMEDRTSLRVDLARDALRVVA